MLKNRINSKNLNSINICYCYYSKQTDPVKTPVKTQPCETYSNPTSPPKIESISCDMIGPPHPISNIRPIIRYKPLNETPLQAKLRQMQNETQLWNQSFWESHNSKFVKERDTYIQKNSKDNRKLNADEMSDFYKEFLDKNWRTHVNYNIEWYRRNFAILLLSMCVNIQSFFHRTNRFNLRKVYQTRRAIWK